MIGSEQAIGVFDSGVGGLSIAREIRALLPGEDIVYVADTLHAPYGEKTEAFIYKRACSIVDFLLAQQVKIVVVACNTATVSTIEKLRQTYSIPFVGVEPGIKPACQASKRGVVGVLATHQTIKSPAFLALVLRLADAGRIELQACPGLMEQVENLAFDEPDTKQLIQQYVQSLVARGVDQLVLGCTHYAFLTDAIKTIAGPKVGIIDTAQAVAREVIRRLTQLHLIRQGRLPGADIFFTSGSEGRVSEQFSVLWGRRVKVAKASAL
ncbi:glutamate racemase [Simiduia curdlanivorans]|uniref:Glutamate racemase n=1 Tax=Simiduia curdlanivorans TaxID=1492769 RepID=A0ABV8V723_9GAMM|nr:glutamate racemase [Simiduia curdlanivorans]MDN3638607.1 glutamate racemase [Simiduia curdlanivorans]